MPRSLSRLALCALPLCLTLSAPVLADQRADDFAAIQAKLGEIRQARQKQEMETFERLVGEIHEQCGAFLDAHLAAASPEQLQMTVSIWFEVANMRNVDVDTIKARLAQVRNRADLPEQITKLLNGVEAKLSIRAGEPAPNWTCVDVKDGSEVTLESLRGKLVLMDFWATWCGPCIRLMKDKLGPLHARYKDDDRFVLVGLGVQWNGETPEKQKAFGEQNGYHWKKVFDRSGEAATSYGVDGIPFLCLVDEEGKILVVGSGFAVIDQVETVLAERLARQD